MTSAVYYNYPPIRIQGVSTNNKGVISYTPPTEYAVNISYHTLDYILSAICLYTENGTSYLILQNKNTVTSDKSNLYIYLVIKLEEGDSGDSGDSKNDINKIMDQLQSGTASEVSCDNLNSLLNTMGAANICPNTHDHHQDGYIVRFENTIKVKGLSSGTKAFTTTNAWMEVIEPIMSSPITWTNQNLDWTFQCSYSDDNGSGTKNEKAVNPDPMHDIVTIMVLLMVASGLYLAMPVIYTKAILGMYADTDTMYLKALDFIWSLNGFLWGLLFVIAAIVKKHNSYYFMSLMVFLILFSCKKWISDNVGDLYDTSADNKNKIENNLNALTGRKNVTINTDYPNIINCAGKGNKALSFAEFCALVFFILSAVYAGVDASKFNYFAYTFMGLIIMVTGFFNGFPKSEKGNYIGGAFIILGIVVIAVGCGIQGGKKQGLDDIPISSKE